MDSGVVGWLALWGAVASAGISCAAGRRRGLADRAGLAAAGLAAIAVGALSFSLLSGNFALTYVADTTTRQGSWPYRLAGLWGGNEGSLLLWAALVLAVGLVATRGRPRARARLVVVATGGALLLVDAVAANPFARLAIPAIDGAGLTPILQYPAMLYHPLLLYAGHAALVGPFALAVAALAAGQFDEAWLAATRRWMLIGWLLLGVALIAGAHWAYVELGWGGFWGWDPVENSGLVPWLAATAWLHRARAIGTDDSGRVGLAGLAALPFALSLVGTTVSRSGAAQSVHAFAHAAAVGRGLLAVVAAALGAVMIVLVRACRRGRSLTDRPSDPASSEQETALVAAVVLVLAMALVVLVGTVFPVVVHVLTGQTIDVTTHYFAVVVTPLAVVAAVIIGVGPSLGHRTRVTRWLAAAGIAAVTAGLLARAGDNVPAVLGAAAVGGGGLSVAELVRSHSLRRAGALIAHTGMALLLLGVAGSLLGRRVTQVVRPGGQLEAGGFTLHYRDAVADQGPGWQRVRLIIDVSQHGHRVAPLEPALRVFDGQAAALSDVALRSTPAEDLVVTVSQIDPTSRAAVLAVTRRPLVVLVWWGGLLAAAGASLVLLAARSRTRFEAASVAATPPSAPAAPLALQETANRRGRRGRRGSRGSRWGTGPLFPNLFR